MSKKLGTLSKSAFYTFLTQIPTQVFGIISGIFITRILGPSGRGIYAIFYADISLFNTLLGFSITTAIIYFLSSKRMSEPKVLGASLIFSLITMILSVIIFLIWINLPVSDLIFPKGYMNWNYIVWFLTFLLLTQVNTVYSGFFQGIRNFKVVNSVLLINSIINIVFYGCAFTLSYLGLFKVGIFEVLILGLLVLIINTWQWHVNYMKYFSLKIDFGFNWKLEIQPFFRYMGLGHLSMVINFFNYRLVLWVLAYYLNEAEVGIFSLAAGLTQMLTFLSNPLSQVLLPFLSSEDQNQRNKTFIRFARVHFSLIFVIAIFGALISPFLIPVLYGKAFIQSVYPFEIMIFAVVLSCQTKILAGFFMADNKVVINLWATIFGFLLTLVFNFTLIQAYGVIGAAWSSAITYIGIFLFVYLAMIIFANIPTVNIFFITREDIKYAKRKFKSKSGKYNRLL